MANTTPSPNMGMPVPTVATDTGPDWATNVNASLSIIDSHDHSSGKGVPVTPAGMNINSDLSFGVNNAYALRSVRFSSQSVPLAAAADIGCLYEAGVDLYYNDGNGNQVRITQSGSVTGASGTITGLPSGTASAAYAAGTFTFQSATNTPANMVFGPVKITRNAAGAKGVTVAANASQVADYSLTLPLALPATTQFLTLDSSGNLALATIASGTYAPTVTSAGAGTGQAAVASSFTYTRVNNQVTVFGNVSGTTDNSGFLYWRVTVPITTIATGATAIGSIAPNGGNGVFANNIVAGSVSAVDADLQVSAHNTSITATVNFTYTCA